MAGEHALAIKYYIMKTHPMMAHGGDSFGDGPEGRNDDPGAAVALGGRFCDQGCAGSAQSQCRGDDLGASALVDGGFNDEDWRFLATAPPELLRPGGVSPWAGTRSVKCLPGGALAKRSGSRARVSWRALFRHRILFVSQIALRGAFITERERDVSFPECCARVALGWVFA